jgi:UDP-N-acetylmuramoylalanine--D-glutamate ligase
MASVVVGLGKTGASCLRYLAKRGIPVSATDTRREPPGLAELGGLARTLDIRLGGFDLSLLDGATQLLMSPGVSLEEPIAAEARARGIEVVGDIELFARAVRAPVIGITGTNGKSTVTSLVARMAAADGRRVLAGGNLGEPALDLLDQPVPDLYVLELSSFQLETTSSLELEAAVVLNVTADHMDRYASLTAYARAKERIFSKAASVVLNLDDPLVAAMRAPRTGASRMAGLRTAAPAAGARVLTFSTRLPYSAAGPAVGVPADNRAADFALQQQGERTFLARRAAGRPDALLLDTARMKISGLHNAANALAALALGEAAGLSLPAMLETLETFPGLKHRSEWIADVAGVRYVDDSKGTNVGATIAAVSGFRGPLIVIAGGEGKGQDFTPLASAFRGKVRHAVLIGKDAAAVEAALQGTCTIERAATLEGAVQAAAAAARPGDTVLLSPACASLDMFRDYAHRGALFAAQVRALRAAATNDGPSPRIGRAP